MNGMWEFLHSPGLSVLLLSLVHLLWQGLLIGILLFSVLKLVRFQSSKTRYGLCFVALLSIAASPFFTFFVVDPPAGYTLKRRSAQASLVAADGEAAASLDGRKSVLETEKQPGICGSAASDASLLSLLRSFHRTVAELTLFFQPYFILVYGAGVMLLSARLLFGIFWFRRVKRLMEPVTGPVRNVADSLCRSFGCIPACRVFISDRISEAMQAGLVRPFVLLPASWVTQLSPEMLEAVIAHELAHLRRLDRWVNLLQRVVETVFFYHPVVWWVSRRLRTERELCCDMDVVAITRKPVVYAKTLEFVLSCRFSWNRSLIGTAIGGKKMMILQRIRCILDGCSLRNRGSRWQVGLFSLFVPVAFWCMSVCFVQSGLADDDPERAAESRRGRESPEKVVRERARREGDREVSPEAGRAERRAPREGDRAEGRREGERERAREGDRAERRRDRPEREGDREKGEGERKERSFEALRKRFVSEEAFRLYVRAMRLREEANRLMQRAKRLEYAARGRSVEKSGEGAEGEREVRRDRRGREDDRAEGEGRRVRRDREGDGREGESPEARRGDRRDREGEKEVRREGDREVPRARRDRRDREGEREVRREGEREVRREGEREVRRDREGDRAEEGRRDRDEEDEEAHEGRARRDRDVEREGDRPRDPAPEGEREVEE